MLVFFSHILGAQYFLGTYDEASGRFRIETHGRFNHGVTGAGGLHAPSGFIDPKGRCIVFFNVKEGLKKAPWWDVMTLPRELFLDNEGGLGMRVVSEVESHRTNFRRSQITKLPANKEVALDMEGGKAIEIAAEIDPGNARDICLNVLRSSDAEEQTGIHVYIVTGKQIGRAHV